MLDDAITAITTNTSNSMLQAAKAIAEAEEEQTSAELDTINIVTSDLLTSFKSIDVAKIYQFNRYYTEFGATYTFGNLLWSTEHILATCDAELRAKVREKLVGVSPMESGGSLVLKIMLVIVMNIDDSALCSLVQSI